MQYDLRNKYTLKSYLAEISPDNYFNDLHQVIRIRFNGKYHDFRYKPSTVLPNPQLHLAVVSATEEEMLGPGLPEERQKLMPGILDAQNNTASLPHGSVEIINKKQLTMVTNAQNGSSAFSQEGSDMSDKAKTRIALTPPLKKDYTNSAGEKESSLTGEDSDSKENTADQSIGVFINDDVVVIKAKGAQITMGEDGIHLGGNIKYEKSEHVREWMFDNTLSRFIPSTIPTGAIAIPELPNVSKFAKYAQTAQRVSAVADKTATAIQLFNRG